MSCNQHEGMNSTLMNVVFMLVTSYFLFKKVSKPRLDIDYNVLGTFHFLWIYFPFC